MVKMKLENKNKLNDIDSISNWLIKTFPKLRGRPMSLEINSQGKINFLDIPDLTLADKKIISKKYPELS